MHIDEFLFRGQPPSKNLPGAWHVVLGNEVADGFGATRVLTGNPMNPTQAAAAGFPLATIIAAINTEALLQVDELTASQTSLQAQVATLTAQNSTLTASQTSLQAQVATLTAQNSTLTASQTSLQAEVATLTAQNAALTETAAQSQVPKPAAAAGAA